MAWYIYYIGYYRVTGTDRRWYLRQVFFGLPFKTERGVTHGGLVSPTIFNIVLDAVVREVLLEFCGPQ